MPIQAQFELIVGLGNPGSKYHETRHNAGFWYLDALAAEYSATFLSDTKFQGEVAKINHRGRDIRLLKPTTFMNRSGQSIAAIARYFKIPVERILVVHDELDLPVGAMRLKKGGGHGGHNGLRDTINQLGKEFWRLRLGIDHPGHRDKVVDYVLERPTREQARLLDEVIVDLLRETALMLDGELNRAMNTLHRKV
ncbi:MAG: aminoacyl-tRNA hydrolase [Gammaproteobacteria bacterium]|nr:aminoacyl-tRNA hydrolase [Gammaproteobacteria bacterium]